MSADASRSWATERMARPIRVRDTNCWRETIRKMARMKMKIDSTEIDAPPIWICQSSGKIWGDDRSPLPASRSTVFWRMNDIPMAVMRGARRGAFRRGR